ncbi:MAG: lipid-A-disaccharide synthase [Chitinophagales bacterium]|nr:lipid-A-disaccharide synthase [Chitinophagales bacterium]
MKLYIIAGEASGDLHGANLIRALKAKEPALQLRGFGGDKMAQAGCEVVKHYRDLAFMGFWEVAVNIRAILANLSFCKQDILQFNPDAVILVDYPGFNLRMAKFLKTKGIKVFYYISPQVWAWKASRIKLIKQCVDKMFVILPFEKAFYAQWNYEVHFVGHPLLDEIAASKSVRFHDSFHLSSPLEKIKDEAIEKGNYENELLKDNFRKENNLDEKKIIALLPGSRKQEISRMLPVMTEMAHRYSDYQFVVAGLSNIGEEFYRQFIHNPDVKLVMDQTYHLLHHAYAAMVTSGTATLETALHGVPQVVCYRGNYFSYLIGRLLVKVKFISLVNLVCDKKVVEELIQNDFNTTHLKAALNKLLDGKERERIFSDYALLKQKLGGEGASKKTAELMLNALGEKK